MKARREVWLSLVLAVAQGLPEPRELTLYESERSAWLVFETFEQALPWLERFDLTAKTAVAGIVSTTYEGWPLTIQFRAHAAPKSSPLAEQVAAAILTPDADVLPVGAS